MKKLIVIYLVVALFSATTYSQQNTDQNGIRTYVSNTLSANLTQARRYEIASISYNSFHWQPGGIVIIELFAQYYSVGYEKYILELGFRQGANYGQPTLKLAESYGIQHSAKLSLGVPGDLNSSYSGYINKSIPVYLDIKNYAGYKFRISYLQDKVGDFTAYNQIKIPDNPVPTDISDFSVSTEIVENGDLVSTGNLRINGAGPHYIASGNVLIGKTTQTNTTYKLDVVGKIRADEIVVNTTGADFVFEPTYNLRSLPELETFIKQNKHLPEIAPAKEMQENGVSAGEMQTKLLQKIEELTLYTIELEKRIKELERKKNN